MKMRNKTSLLYSISIVLHMANCDFLLSQIVVYTSEDLDIEPKLTGLRSTSNEKRRFTLVGIISCMPISSTYDPTHSPCSVAPSCPMSSLKMVFPRSARLSISNENLEGSPNKLMV